ncbi:hypothetical protein E4U17_003853 [Claviceps sp. LM77 group G4]|nr:hypothetical protein E4U17_003853 [Claviceps sp. LM77 group G4]KAG6070157.1 hypothetical protein E4U33_004359 [Claviceps sp. LM78 group G4]KAG6077406.1 hypothetical protein E4U16_002256 [Claviceps sp. LM84 group G4]
MAHYSSESDGWNIGWGRTRTRGRVHDDDDHIRDYEQWAHRSAPFMSGGLRPPPFPPAGFFPWCYDMWEDTHHRSRHELRGRRRSGGGGGGSGGGAANQAVVSHPRSGGVMPAPRAAPDASRFEIVVRDTTDNRLPAWPDNTSWKASIAKKSSIANVIKHITANPGKYMVTVVWNTYIEEELHDGFKVIDLERDALELRVRERGAGPSSLPVRCINS